MSGQLQKDAVPTFIARAGYPLTRARKRHICDHCGQRIEAGEHYDKRGGFGPDGPWTLKQHVECEAETKDWDAGDWECFFPGDGERPVKADNVRLSDGTAGLKQQTNEDKTNG